SPSTANSGGAGAPAGISAAGNARTVLAARQWVQTATSWPASSQAGSGDWQRAQGRGITGSTDLDRRLDHPGVADHVVHGALFGIEPGDDVTNTQREGAEHLGEVTPEGAAQADGAAAGPDDF